MDLLGLHHLTAVSARIRENARFYTGVMGMRLVKRTVNQDDPSAYHLFYADAAGSPGTDLTFFDWPAAPERRGTRSVVRTGLRVRGEAALGWWRDRLAAAGLAPGAVAERDGRLALDFEDPEGQRLALVDDGGAGDPPVPWERSPVPAEYQVRGLGPVTISVPALAPTAGLLTGVLGMRAARTYEDDRAESGGRAVHVFAIGAAGAGEGPHAELHVAVEPGAAAARPGAGGVHHVAFRCRDGDYHAWARHLGASGVPNSGEVDRYWFRSLYLREPGGVLFEIATDGPGFAVDESADALGERVVLAPFLEPRRAEIVAALKPID
jgi:glyoxalase family protein